MAKSVVKIAVASSPKRQAGQFLVSKSARRAAFLSSISGLSSDAVVNKASLFSDLSRDKFSVIKISA